MKVISPKMFIPITVLSFVVIYIIALLIFPPHISISFSQEGVPLSDIEMEEIKSMLTQKYLNLLPFGAEYNITLGSTFHPKNPALNYLYELRQELHKSSQYRGFRP
jgi:hypothetical protein